MEATAASVTPSFSAWRQPGFYVTFVLVLIGGGIVLLMGQDTLRETAFTVLMFVGLAASLNILMGYAGYVNFGHIVFFGLGGYFGFYLVSQFNMPLFPAAIAGGLLSVILALVVGAAVLRLRGAYFALATIGINEAARAFVSNFTPFGGSTGMYVNFSSYDEYGGAAEALWHTFTLLWLVIMALVVVSFLVKNSRFGLGLIAIREDEDTAMVMGVRAPWEKTMAFCLSAFFPGVIGTLYFFKNGNVEPEDAFRFQMSLEILVMVMLGGKGTVLGPVLGAFAYERMRGLLLTSIFFKNLHLAVSGLFLLLIVLFVPGGVVGWVRTRFPRWRRFLE
jgi:branched-chain amino acid transport system permease protein